MAAEAGMNKGMRGGEPTVGRERAGDLPGRARRTEAAPGCADQELRKPVPAAQSP
jgi:hypothetical protein